MEAPEADPGRDHWTEVIPARTGVRLDGVDPFAYHLAVYERRTVETRIRVIEHATGSSTPVVQPESPSTVWGEANPEYDATVLRYGYTSLATPRSVYDLDLRTGELTLRKRQPVLGDFDPAWYRTERQWATADDGTLVPISLVYRPDLVAGPAGGGTAAPCLLYGYGSYEASMDPTFSSLRLSLLDRGFVFAIAHVRGGGELGRHWYEEGKFAAKPNTFSDFVACAHHLVDGGWTAPDRLVARGGSAGGLLMGAVANLAPDLFRAVVAEVPFVDCLTTILDETLPLTVLEWEEWGNPVEDPEIYRVMKSYSPYDNVAAADQAGSPVRYPDILATGGLSDPRVGFWEPAKWVAKLRAANPQNRVLLKTEMGAGHGGPSGRYDAWKDEAFVYAFILDALGLEGTPLEPHTPSRTATDPPAGRRPRSVGQGAAVVVVDADGAVLDVDDAVEPVGVVPGVAVGDGTNVATNGVRTVVGSTTGMVSTWSVRVGVPNCTVVDPEAWTFCTVPAESSPAHTALPVDVESTSTQHDPVPVMVIWNVVWGTV